MSSIPEFPLGKIGAKRFLAEYWQKKPLLIRQAFDGFPTLISGDELAGLSCERGVVSRLIIERGGKTPWEVRHGPFKPKMFSTLPKKRWTLLVNGVDRFVPDVHNLLDYFSFIPNWRIDDVMISFAADGGGVGAHVDNYDVFLIQAAGTREWQIHTKPLLDDDYIPDREVRQLRKFTPNKTWTLEPGDMLYLPPRAPHNGIARGDGCMTYSIGFRAPSYAELLDGATSFAISRLNERLRFSDPGLRLQPPGEIRLDAIEKVSAILRESFLNKGELLEWFGMYVTEPKDENGASALDEPITSSDLKAALKLGARLTRAEGARIAYCKASPHETLLFVNGHSHLLRGKDQALGDALSNSIEIETTKIFRLLASRTASELLLELVNAGAFALR